MRITAGQYRSKKLLSLPGDDVRPTSDKVRQAIFNIMTNADYAPPLPDAVFADVCCGTGAVGLDALSRGAAHCFFIDNNKASLDICRQNNNALAYANQSTLIFADAKTPPTLPAGFSNGVDFFFIDPPYKDDVISDAITAFMQQAWIKPHTIIITETDRLLTLPTLHNHQQRNYGRTHIGFWQLP